MSMVLFKDLSISSKGPESGLFDRSIHVPAVYLAGVLSGFALNAIMVRTNMDSWLGE